MCCVALLQSNAVGIGTACGWKTHWSQQGLQFVCTGCVCSNVCLLVCEKQEWDLQESSICFWLALSWKHRVRGFDGYWGLWHYDIWTEWPKLWLMNKNYSGWIFFGWDELKDMQRRCLKHKLTLVKRTQCNYNNLYNIQYPCTDKIKNIHKKKRSLTIICLFKSFQILYM